MSYNEIYNIILIDSVVLQNKPLQNIEIIDAAKKLSLYRFRGVFLRDALAKKEKLNEYDILNLDSSYSGDTHLVIWFKNVRISSTSIIMEYNLLAR